MKKKAEIAPAQFLLGGYRSWEAALRKKIDVPIEALDTISRALVNFVAVRYGAIDLVVKHREAKYYPAPLPSILDSRDSLLGVVGNAEYQSSARLSEGSFWNILASEFMRHGRRFDERTDEYKSLTANGHIVQSRSRDLDEVAMVPGGAYIAIAQESFPKEALNRLWGTRGFMNAINKIESEAVLENSSLRVLEQTEYEFNPYEIDWTVARKLLSARNKIVALHAIKSVMKSFNERLYRLEKNMDEKIAIRGKKSSTVKEMMEADKWIDPIREEMAETIARKNEFSKEMKLDRNPAVREAVFDIIDEEKIQDMRKMTNVKEFIARGSTGIWHNDLVIKSETKEVCDFLERAAGSKGKTSADPWVERNKARAAEMIQFYWPCRDRREAREKARRR